MRKLGIILAVMGLIQATILIINLTHRGLDSEILIMASCLMTIGVALFLIIAVR